MYIAERETFVPTRRDIEKAIVVLEANRTRLAGDVVAYSLAALHKALATEEIRPHSRQQESVTALVADLQGFTAMSDRMDAEMVRDTMNALWARLDGVIEAWGGRVDKHTGDGLIALFGAAAGYQDDGERAVQAALEMQMALSLFNETAVTPSGKPLDLQMRIAIHRGPIYFSQVGMSEAYMAVGQTIDVANQLQHLAPEGKVLISYEIYWRVHTRYQVTTLAPVRLASKGGLLHVYVVNRENPRTFRAVYQDFEDGPRLVGRVSELEQVQQALEMTMERSQPQFVTIVGEAGIGKTRLLYELAVMIDLLPVRVCELMGQAHPGAGQTPYALIRDLLSNYLGVHAQSSLDAAQGYMVRGLAEVIAQVDASGAEQKAEAIAQFTGVMDVSGGDSFTAVPDRVHNLTFQGVADFIRAIANQYLAVVIFLEDLHWADEGSLDLVEHILQACHDLPMLVVGLARPSLFDKRPSWRSLKSLAAIDYQQIDLGPLSSIDSRHLVMESLGDNGKVPVKLADLIVERASGNPFYIKQLLKMLVDEAVLVKEGGGWRTDPAKMQAAQDQPSLTGMLAVRLELLPPEQQTVVRFAAIFGQAFWQTAVTYLADADDDPEMNARLQEAFNSLLEAGFIIKRPTSTMAGTPEFAFQHRRLQKMAYGSIPINERRIYHAQAAAWLIVHSNQSSEHAGFIAHQFELAEDVYQAADWYGRAGDIAQSRYSVETAVELYQKALSLLPKQESTIDRHIFLNEQLGAMFSHLARFEQAIKAYVAMRDAAQTAGDKEAVMRSWLAMTAIYYRQGNASQMMDVAQQAEAVACHLNQPDMIAAAKIAIGWAKIAVGDTDGALELAKETLAMSAEADATPQMAHSNALIGNICRLMNWHDQGVQTSKTALSLFREAGNRVWCSYMLVNLGQLAQARQQIAKAFTYYQEALGLVSDIGDIYGSMLCLRKLSDLAKQSGDYGQADRVAQQAYLLAERSQSPTLLIRSALQLGNLAVQRVTAVDAELTVEDRDQYLNTARLWLDQAFQMARDHKIPLLAASAKIGMAGLLLEEESLAEAAVLAQDALVTLQGLPNFRQKLSIQKQAARGWHKLALIAARLPANKLPLVIHRKSYNAAKCYSLSAKLFTNVRLGVAYERAVALRDWALYELRKGDPKKGNVLWRRALAAFIRQHRTDEVTWMEDFSANQSSYFNRAQDE